MQNRFINANFPLHFHKKTGGQQVEKTKEKCKKCIFYTFLYRMLADSKISRNFASCFSWYQIFKVGRLVVGMTTFFFLYTYPTLSDYIHRDEKHILLHQPLITQNPYHPLFYQPEILKNESYDTKIHHKMLKSVRCTLFSWQKICRYKNKS